MSTDNDSATDGGNRATVAQTLAEVRGLRDFTGARFSDLQRQLDRVENLPVTVSALQAQNYDQEKRIRALEQHDTVGAEWRRTHLPAMLIAGSSLIATIVFILISLH